ncbi:MAG: hypothetical protein CO093_10655 [Alphaproteobacteria bacterium CG_4_9_14_3_um_filter_47_13]|nr:MAG: hypothetical protein CO093_10655 [Alphaproteobacteria bacterium CG_4_9_14_3_um_filter_47_13]
MSDFLGPPLYLTSTNQWRTILDSINMSFPFCDTALERGNELVLLNMVMFHLRGLDGEKNYTKAIELIDEFASKYPNKNEITSFKAPIYRRGGYGVEKDEQKAFSLWNEAYEKNPENAASACQLNLYYRNGIGTEKDPQKAEELLKKFKEKNPKGECSHKVFDFLFEPSGLEKELLDTEE